MIIILRLWILKLLNPYEHKMLGHFFSDLDMWLQHGMHPHKDFKGSRAICSSLRFWLETNHVPWQKQQTIHKCLEFQWKISKLNVTYPFTDKYQFYVDEMRGTHYDNPKRVAWIKRHAVRHLP